MTNYNNTNNYQGNTTNMQQQYQQPQQQQYQQPQQQQYVPQQQQQPAQVNIEAAQYQAIQLLANGGVASISNYATAVLNDIQLRSNVYGMSSRLVNAYCSRGVQVSAALAVAATQVVVAAEPQLNGIRSNIATRFGDGTMGYTMRSNIKNQFGQLGVDLINMVNPAAMNSDAGMANNLRVQQERQMLSGSGLQPYSSNTAQPQQQQIPHISSFDALGGSKDAQLPRGGQTMQQQVQQPAPVQQPVQQQVQQPQQQPSIGVSSFNSMINDINNQLTQQPVMETTVAPVAQAVASVVNPMQKWVIDSNNTEDLSKLIERNLNIEGGWAVNYELGVWVESDYTKFNNWRWDSFMGCITTSDDVEAASFSDFKALLDKRGREIKNLREFIKEDNDEDINIDMSPEYLAGFVEITNRYNDDIREAYHGMLLGEVVLNTETRPWFYANNQTSTELLNSIIPDYIQDNLEDDEVQVVLINNREYYLIDSRNVSTNLMVVSRRRKLDSCKYRHPDNRSAKGHYYLLNPYAFNGINIGQPIIEDFYDLEEFMIDPMKYNFTPATTAGTFTDELDSSLDLSFTGTPVASLKTREENLAFVDMDPISVAERVRDYYHVNRHQEWDSAVLLGTKLTLNDWVLTATSKDRSFWKDLQDAIKVKAIHDTLSLGDFLAGQIENAQISDRMIRVMDGKLCKAYNNLFNDVLNYDTVVIEDSFMEEYKDLNDIVNEVGTPTVVRAIFVEGVDRIIKNVLTESKMVKRDIEAFTKQTQFEVKDGKLTVTKDCKGDVTDMVHNVKREVSVVVLPMTADKLNINTYANQNTITWNSLPNELHDALRKNFELSSKGITDTVLVTSDNYVLSVQGCSNELAGGSITTLR